jgi:hypothetical protein
MITNLPALISYYQGSPEMTGDSALYGNENALATVDSDSTRWSVGEIDGGGSPGTIAATFRNVPAGVTAAWFVIHARTESDFVGGLRVNSPPVATFDDFTAADYTEFVVSAPASVAADARAGARFELNRPSGGGTGLGVLHVTYWALRVEFDAPSSQRRRQAPPLRLTQRGDGLTGAPRLLGNKTRQSTTRLSGGHW